MKKVLILLIVSLILTTGCELEDDSKTQLEKEKQKTQLLEANYQQLQII